MTRESIIAAGLKCFALYGYQHTSLANIADEVGIKKPSLYNHFDSKEAIFLGVLEDVSKREMEYLDSITTLSANNSIQDRLHQLYDLYIKHMSNSMEGLFFKRVTFFPPEEFTEEIKQVFLKVENEMTKLIRPVIEQGKKDRVVRPLPTETLTSSFYTLLDGLFLEENFYDKDVFEKRQSASWEIFWLGIKHPELEE
ncbi:TetR/AcrR family transcriptional regulator [Halobacillus salinarum]|uniref:TetR/AcrR family transcriptional regulator n=1 Tax=Halobacillus salinarum TaxID=2932257 RepID=A0ABY4EIA6_9BACI|nr:TetR/AcrR family transcriptional regulator [Halobacillus salinarum]UOQ43798.1 TetR/AcrR family transcriptional regulator [Halobacillus salinarum]